MLSPKHASSKTSSNAVAQYDIISTPRDRKKLYAANRRGSPNQAPGAPRKNATGCLNHRAKTLEPRALDDPDAHKPRVAASLNSRAKTLF